MNAFTDYAEFLAHYLQYLSPTQARAFKKATNLILQAQNNKTLGAYGCEIVARYDINCAKSILKELFTKQNIDYNELYFMAKAIEFIVCESQDDEFEKLAFEFLKRHLKAFDIQTKTDMVKFYCFARGYNDVLRFLAYKKGEVEQMQKFKKERDKYDGIIASTYDGTVYADLPIARIVPSAYASLIPLSQMQTEPQNAEIIISNLNRIMADLTSSSQGIFALVPSAEGLATYEYESALDQLQQRVCSDFLADNLPEYMFDEQITAFVVAKICLIN